MVQRWASSSLSLALHQTNGINVFHLIDKPLILEPDIQKSH